jgi:hypothetical protein
VTPFIDWRELYAANQAVIRGTWLRSPRRFRQI